MAELEWSDLPNTRYDKKALQTLQPFMVPNADAPTEILLMGHCPRCLHEMSFPHPLLIVAGFEEVEREAMGAAAEALRTHGVDLSSGDEHIDARCGCKETHPKTPKGESGCGAPFVVRVTWP